MSIIEVLRDQKEELKSGLSELELVPREKEIKVDFFSKLIQVVSGVRRSGKSVLIYKLLEGHEFAYVNFDDDRLIDVLPNDILSGIYQVYGEDCKIIFFDEIQNLEHWELFVNRLHRAGFKLFLTGSNAKLLAREMASHLTGRHLTLELFPFSFKEYLFAKGVDLAVDIETTKGKAMVLRQFDRYLDEGGFPEVVCEREKMEPYVRELYSKIVSRDIIGRYNVSYKRTFREIANSIMSNPARILSYRKLRLQFGLGSEHTVKNYLSYLEEAYLVFFLSKFSFKPVEIEKSHKKAYVIDTSLIKALSLQRQCSKGAIYENVVFLELIRRGKEIYYWKSFGHEEIDFVVRKEGKVRQLIQVCYSLNSEKVINREVRSLIKGSFKLRCSNLLLITGKEEGKKIFEIDGRKKEVELIPLWKWLLVSG